MQAINLSSANIADSLGPIEKSIAAARILVGTLRVRFLDSVSLTGRRSWPRTLWPAVCDDLRGNWRDRGA